MTTASLATARTRRALFRSQRRASRTLSRSRGGGHTCALLATKRVKCWGWNGAGQLGSKAGLNQVTPSSFVPVKVRGIKAAAVIAAGYEHTCARLSSGKVFCWVTFLRRTGKRQDSGQLETGAGRRYREGDLDQRRRVLCAVVPGRKLKCWGDNTYGQLGNGEMGYRTSPVGVVGFPDSSNLNQR